MNPLINISIEAARAAGRIIVKASERPDLIKVIAKPDGDGYTTEIKHRSAQAIIHLIKKAYPDHGVLLDETQDHQEESEVTWIINPLDGVENFMHNCPHYAISIAIKIADRIEHSVIYDPVRDELFIATAGRGAQLNGHRIRLQQRAAEQAIIAIAYPRPSAKEAAEFAEKVVRLTPIAGGIRFTGSAALDLAYLAAARFDACLTANLGLPDFAAGALLISEAGGLISDWQGDDHYRETGQLYAAHPKLFKHFIKAISS
jgi:myo-inositol-1(or 4)-monophosphatase